jgi:ribbon-helix-helix CopG family protein
MTLPADLLREVDREALQQDRSRSWLIAEALRRYLGHSGASSKPEPAPKSTRSPAAGPAKASPSPRHLTVFSALSREGAQYLVPGGPAALSQGELAPLEILIARSWENAARVLVALEGVGYSSAPEWLPETILQQPMTVVVGDPLVRVYTSLAGLKYEAALPRVQRVTVGGIQIPVLGPGTPPSKPAA